MSKTTTLRQPIHGGNLIWAAEVAGCQPGDVLDFSASINPLGPPQSAIAAIQSHLSDLKVYPDPTYRALRGALGQFHRLPADWILPGNGVAELLTWAGRELSRLEATYLITPAFNDYWRSLKSHAANIIPCPLRERESGWQVPVLDRSKHLSQTGLLLNNPHNPTGLLLLRKHLFPNLKQFVLVVVDEAFMDFLLPDQQQSLVEAVLDSPNLVVLRSLTKFYGLPGLRLGYAIAHPDRLRRWQQWRDPWPVNALAVAAAQTVIQDQEFQQQTWDWLTPTRQKLFDGLAQLPGLVPYPGAANFLLVRTEQPGSQVQQRLLQHSRILIRDCLSFPELGDRYFRVAIRTEAENQQLLQGLRDVLW